MLSDGDEGGGRVWDGGDGAHTGGGKDVLRDAVAEDGVVVGDDNGGVQGLYLRRLGVFTLELHPCRGQ